MLSAQLATEPRHDIVNSVSWPDGFTYYVDHYNIVPSREFYDYVMSWGNKR